MPAFSFHLVIDVPKIDVPIVQVCQKPAIWQLISSLTSEAVLQESDTAPHESHQGSVGWRSTPLTRSDLCRNRLCKTSTYKSTRFFLIERSLSCWLQRRCSLYMLAVGNSGRPSMLAGLQTLSKDCKVEGARLLGPHKLVLCVTSTALVQSQPRTRTPSDCCRQHH